MKLNKNEEKRLTELFSSAFTMSDMELFIFPELVYAGVLGNIISPLVWNWQKDNWFKDIEKKNPNQQIQRLKQYIMDNYIFNLDLETWGLTKKEVELERFSTFISENDLAKSNALFGYEGDKYYFSVDIRKHFGLDKYTTDIIPYWKTETVEAMTAFQYKENYSTGAGECVSLANLYIAALFIVLRIPLEQIFVIGTPLHSQNFIDINNGIITNNRRILTKNMWFNGTIISDKARRALENENISYISHISGYIHRSFKEATIDKDHFLNFKNNLTNFLHTDINQEIFINFLRSSLKYQPYFQIEYESEGKKRYIDLEVLFKYELSSKNKISDNTRTNLLKEVDLDDFEYEPKTNRIVLNQIEKLFNQKKFCCKNAESIVFWKDKLKQISEIEDFIEDLKNFSCTKPKLPNETEKVFSERENLEITPEMTRPEIIKYLNSKKESSLLAKLTFMTARFLDQESWPYFLKASIERNPVSIQFFKTENNLDAIYKSILRFENISIYSEKQFATPDEVINFKRGDGIEKAILFSNIIISRDRNSKINIVNKNDQIHLSINGKIYQFTSTKNLELEINIEKKKYKVKILN